MKKILFWKRKGTIEDRLKEGVKDLEKALNCSSITKFYFDQRVEDRKKDKLFDQLFVGDMSTSKLLPEETHKVMKALVQKYGYDFLDVIAEDYLSILSRS